MLKINGKGIRVTRGDSIRFVIRLTGREVADGTQTLFSVKKRAWRHEEPVLEVVTPVLDSRVMVLLTPDMTEMDAGNYVWDLRVLEDNEGGRDVLTPMAYATFEVVEAIGRE